MKWRQEDEAGNQGDGKSAAATKDPTPITHPLVTVLPKTFHPAGELLKQEGNNSQYFQEVPETDQMQ